MDKQHIIETLLEWYQSYLAGNDYPSPKKLRAKMQELMPDRPATQGAGVFLPKGHSTEMFDRLRKDAIKESVENLLQGYSVPTNLIEEVLNWLPEIEEAQLLMETGMKWVDIDPQNIPDKKVYWRFKDDSHCGFQNLSSSLQLAVEGIGFHRVPHDIVDWAQVQYLDASHSSPAPHVGEIPGQQEQPHTVALREIESLLNDSGSYGSRIRCIIIAHCALASPSLSRGTKVTTEKLAEIEKKIDDQLAKETDESLAKYVSSPAVPDREGKKEHPTQEFKKKFPEFEFSQKLIGFLAGQGIKFLPSQGKAFTDFMRSNWPPEAGIREGISREEAKHWAITYANSWFNVPKEKLWIEGLEKWQKIYDTALAMYDFLTSQSQG